MFLSRPAVRGVGTLLAFVAFVAFVTSVAAEPVHVLPRDPRLMVERLARRLDWRDGLPVSYLVAATQDRDGFIWVAGPGGLSRFDGTQFATVYREPTTLISGCDESGRVVFNTRVGLSEVSGERLVDLGVPDRPGPGADWAAAVAADGGVWWLLDNRLWRRDASGGWAHLPSPAPAGDPALRMHTARGGAVFVWNRSRLWRVAPNGSPREIVAVRGIRAPLEREDGSIFVGANQEPGPVTTRIFEVHDGAPRLLFERVGAKLLEIAMRGDRMWLATDSGYFGISDRESPLFIAPSEMSNASGSVLIDREGSLWSATFRGLVQLPEPETFAAGYVKVARTVARSGDRIWMSTWGDLERFEDGPEGLDAYSYGAHFGIVCADGAGRVWTRTERGLVRVGERAFDRNGVPVRGELISCTVGPSGTMWVGE